MIATGKFGRWTIVKPVGKRGRHPTVLARCECGIERTVLYFTLKYGKSRSCGCLQRQLAAKQMTQHGHARRGLHTPEYNTWDAMNTRCHNGHAQGWARYGGRGISVCSRWRNSFSAFLSDVGPRPGPGYTIDRIDNNGNYEPGNVRWAMNKEQIRNRANTKHIKVDGVLLPLASAAEIKGISYSTVYNRLARGLSDEQALSTNYKE